MIQINTVYQTKLQTKDKFLVTEVKEYIVKKHVHYSIKGYWIGKEHLGICPIQLERLIVPDDKFDIMNQSYIDKLIENNIKLLHNGIENEKKFYSHMEIVYQSAIQNNNEHLQEKLQSLMKTSKQNVADFELMITKLNSYA